jgi:hypothetical protein
MTTLHNRVEISATPEKVWSALAKLEALQDYDPAIAKSEVETTGTSGLGASRRCALKDGGWFREKVTIWEPHRVLAFELHDCSLPVRRLAHRYTLTERAGTTLVEQRMDYTLKFGPIGALLDRVLVRRRWDQGIKAFFLGLKGYVESP